MPGLVRKEGKTEAAQGDKVLPKPICVKHVSPTMCLLQSSVGVGEREREGVSVCVMATSENAGVTIVISSYRKYNVHTLL